MFSHSVSQLAPQRPAPTSKGSKGTFEGSSRPQLLKARGTEPGNGLSAEDLQHPLSMLRHVFCQSIHCVMEWHTGGVVVPLLESTLWFMPSNTQDPGTRLTKAPFNLNVPSDQHFGQGSKYTLLC